MTRRAIAGWLVFGSLSLTSPASATGGDGWPAMAHDAKRTARSAGVGAISAAPAVAWKRPVGGALAESQVATHDIDGDGAKDVVMVSAGSIVARRANDSQIWKSENIGARKVSFLCRLPGADGGQPAADAGPAAQGVQRGAQGMAGRAEPGL